MLRAGLSHLSVHSPSAVLDSPDLEKNKFSTCALASMSFNQQDTAGRIPNTCSVRLVPSIIVCQECSMSSACQQQARYKLSADDAFRTVRFASGAAAAELSLAVQETSFSAETAHVQCMQAGNSR